MHPERTGRDALFGPDGTGGTGPTPSQAAGGADVPCPHVADAGAPVPGAPVPGPGAPVPAPAPGLATSGRPLAVGWNPAAGRTAPSAPAGYAGPAGSPTTAAPTGAGRAAAAGGSPWRPRVEPEPSILGLSRLSRGALGSRLFTLGFAAIFTLIAVQMVVALLTG